LLTGDPRAPEFPKAIPSGDLAKPQEAKGRRGDQIARIGHQTRQRVDAPLRPYRDGRLLVAVLLWASWGSSPGVKNPHATQESGLGDGYATTVYCSPGIQSLRDVLDGRPAPLLSSGRAGRNSWRRSIPDGVLCDYGRLHSRRVSRQIMRAGKANWGRSNWKRRRPVVAERMVNIRRAMGAAPWRGCVRRGKTHVDAVRARYYGDAEEESGL